jgi:hypothetical protein
LHGFGTKRAGPVASVELLARSMVIVTAYVNEELREF